MLLYFFVILIVLFIIILFIILILRLQLESRPSNHRAIIYLFRRFLQFPATILQEQKGRKADDGVFEYLIFFRVQRDHGGGFHGVTKGRGVMSQIHFTYAVRVSGRRCR